MNSPFGEAVTVAKSFSSATILNSLVQMTKQQIDLKPETEATI